jgi:hypothetical protein
VCGYRSEHIAVEGYERSAAAARLWLAAATCALGEDQRFDPDVLSYHSWDVGPSGSWRDVFLEGVSSWKHDVVVVKEAWRSEGCEYAAVLRLTGQLLERNWALLSTRATLAHMWARVPSEAVSDGALSERFSELAEIWRRETGHLSSVSAKSMHPAYQRIIGIGSRVVPLIMAELAGRADHWFWALRAITGEDPVAPDYAGDVERMRQAWLRLGRERGWL